MKRALIANRGEVAVRIARAARSLGIETIGVHTPPDDRALHTRLVTRSVLLDDIEPVAAHLDVDRLVQVAVDNGCDALHPGYGFLSERPALAAACEAAGLTFVGPPSATLALFGDKVAARDLAVSLGIPVIPGGQVSGTAHDAVDAAEQLGFPVMLKAVAGGGGRGMRRVDDSAQLAEAFMHAGREAEAAFGAGALYVEKLLDRPRHVEVQVLADRSGGVVHLHDRDCSVQRRHQKVVEIAPAPNLDDGLRARIADAAVRLIGATDYVGAGTVEFLVLPERHEFFFIECNPRLQVEHTVTEQITGIDIVEAQFDLAAGATLGDIGLADQASVPAPRGFAVQARVVATGPGTIDVYREPSGPGVRVDSGIYSGFTPPPIFDPLLAKVIASSSSTGTLESAADRCAQALDELHIAGVPTNIAELHHILGDTTLRRGDARTTHLDTDASTAVTQRPSVLAALFDDDRSGQRRSAGGPTTPTTRPPLAVADGDEAVRSPLDGALVEVPIQPGQPVAVGATVAVVTAMKMETTVVAPCSGTVASVLDLQAGEPVAEGEVLVTLTPGEVDQTEAATASGDWSDVLAQVQALRDLAAARLAPDSDDPGVVRQRRRNKLTCRERIERLLDPGSFREVGSAAGFASYDADGVVAAFTPANHVGGTGTIDRRNVVVCADDFTSRGGHADGAIGQKSTHLDRLAIELRSPSIRLLDGSSGGGSVAAMVPQQRAEGESKAKESTGAITAGRPRVSGGGGSFLPPHLGSTMYAEQLSLVPVVNMLLGSVVGIGAAKAVLGHFSVMVRDISQLFVAGPPVVEHAMGYDITKEELGGWHIHCRNGSVDNLAETEDDAIAQTRRFLSYLPPSVFEVPPVLTEPGDAADREAEELAEIIPRARTTTFDIRRVIELVADEGSFFEIGALWGTDQVTGLARLDGHPVGVIASDSRHSNGGALTADGCSKLRRHLDLCDLFHIPVLNLVDNPGFAVGLEHERSATIRRGGEWMIAFAQVQVPIFTVIMRRSFGVAGNNYASPRARPGVRVVWPAADVGGIPPEGGIEAAYKRQLAEAEDPVALRAELYARIERARGPLGPLSRFQMEEMIDPRQTRPLVCDWVRTAYRIVAEPDRLGPRSLGFRP